MQQFLAKTTVPFRHLLNAAISRRDEETRTRASVLPGIHRPTFTSSGDVQAPKVPVLVAITPEPGKLPTPILAVPHALSPFTTISSIVENARRQALLMAYAQEIETYPDTPLF